MRRQALIAFHYRKAAKSRASRRPADPRPRHLQFFLPPPHNGATLPRSQASQSACSSFTRSGSRRPGPSSHRCRRPGCTASPRSRRPLPPSATGSYRTSFQSPWRIAICCAEPPVERVVRRRRLLRRSGTAAGSTPSSFHSGFGRDAGGGQGRRQDVELDHRLVVRPCRPAACPSTARRTARGCRLPSVVRLSRGAGRCASR